MKNVAVILSGCGVFDGAEIHDGFAVHPEVANVLLASRITEAEAGINKMVQAVLAMA